MHVLTVCYGKPEDPAAFDAYYRDVHTPLAEKIPGLAGFTARRCAAMDSSEPPYYFVAELAFESQQELAAGMGSPEGKAAGEDLANFATGGVTFFIQYD